MVRSLPGSPLSDSSCSLPSTPQASREYFDRKRQETRSSAHVASSDTNRLGKCLTPSPTPLGTPRLNFGLTRQALTPRRALTSVKPISKATRSGRKSFWAGTGVVISDEETDASCSNGAGFGRSGSVNPTLMEVTEDIKSSEWELGDALTPEAVIDQQGGESSDTDDGILCRSSKLLRTRITESESGEEEPLEDALDVDRPSTSRCEGGEILEPQSGVATPPPVASHSEDDSEEEVVVNRRRGRRRIVIESDDEDEHHKGPPEVVSINGGDDACGPVDSSTSSRGQEEDLLAIIDRLYINDIASEDESPPPPKHYTPPQKEIIIISDGESSVEQDALDDYLLQYSPSPERPPIELPITPSAPEKTAIKKTPKGKGVRASQKAWVTERVRIAEELFDELDADVFKGRLRGAGAKLEWNTRLLTTAGTATDKTKRLPNGEVQHKFTIKLSTKVLDEAERVLSTVAHEMCHLASWIINNEYSNPHGRVFQSWGRRVMRARPDIEVTTKHDYEIAYKYSWKCVDDECGKIYKRQSKSIDINRHACGRCKSRLEPMFATKATSAFQDYLKVNMKNAKLALPGSSFGDVMRELSARWKAGGIDHDAYWAGRAALKT